MDIKPWDGHRTATAANGNSMVVHGVAHGVEVFMDGHHLEVDFLVVDLGSRFDFLLGSTQVHESHRIGLWRYPLVEVDTATNRHGGPITRGLWQTPHARGQLLACGFCRMAPHTTVDLPAKSSSGALRTVRIQCCSYRFIASRQRVLSICIVPKT